MPNFADLVKTSRSDLVYLARMKEIPSGKDAWYYVQLRNRALVPVFLEKIKIEIELTEYGDVLFSGWGTEPPAEIRKKVEEMFS